jgi:quercetin dioxygenase-like cupin family protein
MRNKGDTNPALSEALVAALAEATAPVAPDPGRAARIRNRLLSAVRAEKARPPSLLVTIHASEGQWISLSPLVQMKLLRQDEHSRSFLLRMAPGAVLPAHEHHWDEECMVLEGEVWLGDIRVRAGDYHLAPKGVPHGQLRSDTGCLLFLRGQRNYGIGA